MGARTRCQHDRRSCDTVGRNRVCTRSGSPCPSSANASQPWQRGEKEFPQVKEGGRRCKTACNVGCRDKAYLENRECERRRTHRAQWRAPHRWGRGRRLHALRVCCCALADCSWFLVRAAGISNPEAGCCVEGKHGLHVLSWFPRFFPRFYWNPPVDMVAWLYHLSFLFLGCNF